MKQQTLAEALWRGIQTSNRPKVLDASVKATGLLSVLEDDTSLVQNASSVQLQFNCMVSLRNPGHGWLRDTMKKYSKDVAHVHHTQRLSVTEKVGFQAPL